MSGAVHHKLLRREASSFPREYARFRVDFLVALAWPVEIVLGAFLQIVI